MKRAWGWVALAATASALVACSLIKKPGIDGGEDAAGEATAAVPAETVPAEAVNASEMTRYPDEKPVDHAPLTAESGGNLRTQAGPGGDLVIPLRRGTEVEKLAEHGGYYLVLADDPKEPTHKLMGWVAESAFTAAEPFHRSEPEMRGDAGTERHAVDAGTKPLPAGPGKPPSAGPITPLPAGPSKPLDVRKTNGSCPPGYAGCAAVCRLTCRADADCDNAAARCAGGFCMGPGATACK